MYKPINFATFQLHLGNEVATHTISKCMPVYEKNLFPFNQDKLLPQKDLTKEVRKNILNSYQKKITTCKVLLSRFTWHLN